MSKKYPIQKLFFFILGLCALWLIYTFTPVGRYFSLGYVQEQSGHYKSLVDTHYYAVVLCYLAVFIITVALSIPSSIILTLLGGSLFGVLAGAAYATLSVGIGVVLACMVYRAFFFQTFTKLYADRIEKFRRSMQEYGVSYLLMLHFSAIFPYAIINSVALLAQVPLRTILWTAVVGFLPQAFVYSFAGKKLSSIHSVSDIFSPAVITAFTLLILIACLPILLKKLKKNLEI